MRRAFVASSHLGVALLTACGAVSSQDSHLPEIEAAERASLQSRSKLRPGDIVEAVPGVVATRHSGDGKANRYFLRGFNLDHGTDFAVSEDAVPVDMPTHSHRPLAPDHPARFRRDERKGQRHRVPLRLLHER